MYFTYVRIRLGVAVISQFRKMKTNNMINIKKNAMFWRNEEFFQLKKFNYSTGSSTEPGLERLHSKTKKNSVYFFGDFCRLERRSEKIKLRFDETLLVYSFSELWNVRAVFGRFICEIVLAHHFIVPANLKFKGHWISWQCILILIRLSEIWWSLMIEKKNDMN